MGRYVCIFAFAAAVAFAAADDWASWRGPDNNGVARSDAPLNWSDTENIKWKAAIPGRGNSSPIVWGDKIFLTTAIPTGTAAARPVQPVQGPPPGILAQRRGAPRGRGGARGGPGGGSPQTEHRFVVLCLDKNSGEVLWEQTAITATPHEGFHQEFGSFASGTPVTDGERVYAFFGSRGLYAYDLEGTLAWKKDFGVQMRMRNEFGEGAAPTLHGDVLLLKFDHTGDSFIAAVNKNTGEELWRQSRDENDSWSAPLVLEHEGRLQAIVAASNKARSYDLKTGELIWECAGLGANQIPMPVAADGIVYVMSGYQSPNLLAIRLGGTGDITGTDAVLWTQDRGLSYVSSPVLADGKLYVLNQSGMLSCFDAKTGEPYYHQQRLPKPYSFKSSLVAADGKLYMASENDDTVVVGLGENLEILATNTLTGQIFLASPAIVDGDIFLRSTTTLYAIGAD